MVAMKRRTRGETLLLTLVTLLILSLGLLYSMRNVSLDALLSGNTLARQKDIQVSDFALRALEQAILNVYADQPLEISASGQLWYRSVAAGTAPPSAAYWKTCLGSGNAATRCGSLVVAIGNGAGAYTALAVVQPTGRSDAYACGLSQFHALYYDIFINVAEPGGVTSTTTETVYRICTLS